MSTDFNTIISQANSQRTKKEKAEELVQLVIFDLDDEEYAVPIEDLREIIRIPEIAPVPNAPAFIRGILNLRGTIVVVIDLEKRFKMTRENKTLPSHIIVTQIEGNSFGLVVDRVSEVMRVPVSKIQPAPSLVSSKIQSDFLKGVAVLEKEVPGERGKKKSRLIIIMDLPKMLSEEELLRVGSMIGEKTNDDL